MTQLFLENGRVERVTVLEAGLSGHRHPHASATATRPCSWPSA